MRGRRLRARAVSRSRPQPGAIATKSGESGVAFRSQPLFAALADRYAAFEAAPARFRPEIRGKAIFQSFLKTCTFRNVHGLNSYSDADSLKADYSHLSPFRAIPAPYYAITKRPYCKKRARRRINAVVARVLGWESGGRNGLKAFGWGGLLHTYTHTYTNTYVS